jgi:hypothetical protein
MIAVYNFFGTLSAPHSNAIGCLTDETRNSPRPMQIAMLCTKSTLTSGDEYLTNELAAVIASQGHQVQAVVLEWSAPSGAAAAV